MSRLPLVELIGLLSSFALVSSAPSVQLLQENTSDVQAAAAAADDYSRDSNVGRDRGKRHVGLSWPRGYYGLPMPTTGCPESCGFVWKTGYRYHDTEDTANANSFSSPLHLEGQFTSDIKLHFCMKTVSSQSSSAALTDWPRGAYCIFKHSVCPVGFSSGSIHWDDEDTNNANSHGGHLPTGSYSRNTRVYFCCRNDNPTWTAISLPTVKPFYLLAETSSCQQVTGMSVRREYVLWDDQDVGNHNDKNGDHPYSDGSDSNHKLYFCYYY